MVLILREANLGISPPPLFFLKKNLFLLDARDEKVLFQFLFHQSLEFARPLHRTIHDVGLIATASSAEMCCLIQICRVVFDNFKSICSSNHFVCKAICRILVLFSCQLVSESLGSHEPQHASPCPPPYSWSLPRSTQSLTYDRN